MKLTQQEAQLVLNEAYRLKGEYALANSSLGQSLWWTTASEDSKLIHHLAQKFEFILHSFTVQGIDFYYGTDDNKTLEKFYEHFVEQQGE
jgi:hypothetical protein